MTSKKDLSERDICTKYINPALEKAGWNMLTQIREEVSFTDGRIYVKGNLTSRGKRKRADYILYYKPNIPIAIIEAKDNKHSVKAGIQQGLGYGEILDIPMDDPNLIFLSVSRIKEKEFRAPAYPATPEVPVEYAYPRAVLERTGTLGPYVQVVSNFKIWFVASLTGERLHAPSTRKFHDLWQNVNS